MSYRRASRTWIFWGAMGGGLALAAILVVAVRLAGAVVPYNPVFEFAGISNSATSANANITFRTSLPAGNSIIGSYGLEVPDNSWNIAGHSSQLNGKVTVFGTLAINLDPDGSCTDGDTGAPQNYGPFPLLDVDPGAQGPYAQWSGTITDFGDGNPATNWTLTLNVEQLGTGFTIDGFATDAILPLGNTVCTPEILTLTLCGRANPTVTGACGSGTNPVVMTNPAAAGCYNWRFVSVDDSGQSSASLQAGVSIGGTPCLPTPTPTATPGGDSDGDGVPDGSDNCPRWPNPSQNLPPWPVPANDPDCDGFSTAVENSTGTNAFLQCGFNAWPADVNYDTFADGTDITSLSGSFGKSVPPAPARYNIAPDPVDGFVDGTDITKVSGFFGRTCAPCPGDLDCDAVVNAADNCPNWYNPAQTLPAWPVTPATDPDCDGFSSVVEASAGTNSTGHCGNNAWPADLNNDGFSDGTDITVIAGSFGKSVPPAPARHNIAPDPVDGFVDGTDITRVAGFFGKSCS